MRHTVGPPSRHFRSVTHKVLVERVNCCEIVALSIFGPLLSVQMLSLVFHMLYIQNVKQQKIWSTALGSVQTSPATSGVTKRCVQHEETVTPQGSEGRHHQNKKNSAPFVLSAAVSLLACVYYTEGEAVAITLTKESHSGNPRRPVCFYRRERRGCRGRRGTASAVQPRPL